MNILVVTNLYPLPWEPNRATFNKQQFDRLADKHDVDIVVPIAWMDYWKHRQHLKASTPENIKYVCYWYIPKIVQSFFGWFMFWSVWFQTRKDLKEKAYDAILGSWAHPDGFTAAQIAKRLGIPYFIKVHGSDINILTQQPKRRRQIAEVCQSAKHVFTPSDALKEKVIGLGVSNSSVSRIYNGVNPHLFYLDSSSSGVQQGERNHFLFVGNLKRDKGVLDLMLAYKKYLELGGEYLLTYIGAGPEAQKLSLLASEFGIKDKVTFRGALAHENVAAYVRSCSALILPSYHEGVPNVLLEAANCGVPVISTKVGGIPEVVESNITGILFEAGDVDELKTAMISFSSIEWDKELIAQKGKAFSWDDNVRRVEEVLSTCLNT
ncbi:MAG: glycosyltransferase [Oleiphilus sp.]